MNLRECAVECDKTYQTMLRWCAMGKFPFKKAFKEIVVDPDDWAKFCEDNGIVRKGGK